MHSVDSEDCSHDLTFLFSLGNTETTDVESSDGFVFFMGAKTEDTRDEEASEEDEDVEDDKVNDDDDDDDRDELVVEAMGVEGEAVREQITKGRGAEVGVVSEIASVSQGGVEGVIERLSEGACCGFKALEGEFKSGVEVESSIPERASAILVEFEGETSGGKGDPVGGKTEIERTLGEARLVGVGEEDAVVGEEG